MTFTPKIGVTSLLVITLVLLAGSADAINGIARLEVEMPEQSTNWWRSLLGLRAPRIIRPAVGAKFTVNASAYASSPYQTDATPCTTAAGTTVRPGIIATNFLPIGTLLDINGHKFIVEDRMHPRYRGYFLDVWFPSTSQALEFGRRKLVVTILGYGEVGQVLTPSLTPEKKKTVAEEPSESFLKRVSSWLTARIALDPDRHDVTCGDLPDEEFVRLNALTDIP